MLCFYAKKVAPFGAAILTINDFFIFIQARSTDTHISLSHTTYPTCPCPPTASHPIPPTKPFSLTFPISSQLVSRSKARYPLYSDGSTVFVFFVFFLLAGAGRGEAKYSFSAAVLFFSVPSISISTRAHTHTYTYILISIVLAWSHCLGFGATTHVNLNKFTSLLEWNWDRNLTTTARAPWVFAARWVVGVTAAPGTKAMTSRGPCYKPGSE